MPTKTQKKTSSEGRRLAESIYFPAIKPDVLEALAIHGKELGDYVRSLTPIESGLDIPRPSQKDVDRAFNEAVKTLRVVARKAKKRMPAPADLERLRANISRELVSFFNDPWIDRAAIENNLANVPIIVRFADQNLAYQANDRLGGVLLNTTQDGDAVAYYILLIDIILEVIGLILGCLGLKFPKPNAEKLVGRLWDAIKTDGFKEAMKKLIKALKERDALAIIQALTLLRELGVLGEILTGYFADLDWLDYAIAILKFLAFLALALGTAGGAALVKIAAVLLNTVEILVKVRQLGKI